MKKILMVWCLAVFALAANAQKECIAGVEFGASHAKAMETLKTAFGAPVSDTPDLVEFKNVKFEGQTFSQVFVYFDNDKMNQARFYIACASKAQAVQKMNEIEKSLAARYKNMSADQEDDGSKFVKGGLGPDGQSLFTIYTFKDRKNGFKWTAGLRYGAFML